MSKHYVTFGSDHVHRVNGKTFDCDCVATFEASSPEEGREKAFKYFGTRFCFEYSEKYWDPKTMKYYPRGYINVN